MGKVFKCFIVMILGFITASVGYLLFRKKW